MFKNYLIVTFRNLRKNKIHSLINIIGLGTGIACCILSYCFIHDEVTFDRFHTNLDRIFDVKGMIEMGDMGRAATTTKAPLGPSIQEQFPEVVSAVRMTKEPLVVKYQNRVFEQEGMAADPDFFHMFDFPLESQVSESPLSNPDTVVINRVLSETLFGRDDPKGETLAIKIGEEYQDFTINGITTVPDNSSIQFDLIINLEKVYGDALYDWKKGPALPCFVQLQNKDQADALQAKFRDTIDAPLRKYSDESGYRLQSFAGYHLGRSWSSPALESQSDPKYSIILGSISLLVLLIACFNFMNISIGNASSRLREIGVRKVLGAFKTQIIKQFWFESIFFSLLSLFIGLLMVEAFLPVFNSLSQKSLQVDMLTGGLNIGILFSFVLAVGILAGSYPALVLSGFSSIDLFRGKLKLSRRNTFSRVLIVFQFSISIFLLVVTIFLFKQHHYLLHKDLGYEKNHVVILPLQNFSSESEQTQAMVNDLKYRLLKHDTILNVSASAYGMSSFWMATYFEPLDGEKFLVTYNYVDYDFADTLGLHLLDGRNFRQEHPTDLRDAVVVNERFVKALSIDSPVGRRLSEFIKGDFDRQIIGVVGDFHSQSLHDPIYPSFFGMASDTNFNQVFVKIKGSNIAASLDILNKEFSAAAPNIPFIYSFLDDEVANLYTLEKNWSNMVNYSSFFAIFITCTGLFGLTLLITTRKAKEIGVRKILGASLSNIIKLLQQEFVWLILAANVIAWPISYYAMSTILQNYAYRVPLGFWVFLLAGGAALLMALLTTAFIGLKAGRSNLVEFLRYE